MASLLELPHECLQAVLQHCAVRDWQAFACASQFTRDTIADDGLWRSLAERKWGPRVKGAGVKDGGWQAWCTHRMAARAMPASPLSLLQEHFPDPWEHLACCLLCSRTTGGPVVRGAVHAFLRRYPSPSALLDGARGEALEALRPLGLQQQRHAALADMSEGFLGPGWEDPSAFKGCGKFTSDSWRIFCRGERGLAGVEDANLRRYLRWLSSGEVEPLRRGGAAAGRRRKREERPLLDAGALRSGRRRGQAGEPAAAGGAASQAARAARPKRSCTVAS